MQLKVLASFVNGGALTDDWISAGERIPRTVLARSSQYRVAKTWMPVGFKAVDGIMRFSKRIMFGIGLAMMIVGMVIGNVTGNRAIFYLIEALAVSVAIYAATRRRPWNK